MFHRILYTLLHYSVKCKRSFLKQRVNDNKQFVWFTAKIVTPRPQNVQQTTPSSDVVSLENITPTSDTEQEATSSGPILPSDINFGSLGKLLSTSWLLNQT